MRAHRDRPTTPPTDAIRRPALEARAASSRGSAAIASSIASRLRSALALAALSASFAGFASSCAAGNEIDTTTGEGGSASATGSGGSGGAGGGATACEPGAVEPCYEGPAGTEGVGACAAGQKTCADDGSAFGACMAQVLPMPADDCKTPEDEDCDGKNAVCAGDPIWAQASGDVADQRALAIAIDGAGDILVTGAFAGSMTVGGTTLTSNGGLDIFVLKLDPTGVPLWAVSIGGPSDQIGNAIATDSAKNVIVGGDLKGGITVAGQAVNSAGAEDALVLKLDAAGKPLWAKAFGDIAAQSVRSIAMDASDNIVLLASAAGTVSFGGAPLTSNGAEDIVLAKLNPGGNHLFSKIFGGVGSDVPGAVTLDAAGKMIITGSFTGSINFGGAPITSAGGSDIFVTRFSEAGIHLWSKAFGDASDQIARAATTDAAGAIFVAGSFQGAVDFGGGAMKSAGTDDLFVAKLDPSGAFAWAKSFGDASAQVANRVKVDAQGNVVIAGSLAGSADFGGGALTSAGLNDALVVKLDPSGAHLFSHAFGDSDDQSVRALAIDPSGDIVIAGQFKGGMTLGDAKLSAAGAFDMFVAKIAP